MFKNILIPTDGSPLSLKAALNGVKLAQALGAKIVAFYAAPPATTSTSRWTRTSRPSSTRACSRCVS